MPNKKTIPDFLLPDRKKIIKFLDDIGRPQTRNELAKAFNIIDLKISRALGRRLKAMRKDGEVGAACLKWAFPHLVTVKGKTTLRSIKGMLAK